MSTLIERRKVEWDSMMKSSLTEATISVLNEYGFDGLRMDRVATAAEVSKGTVYNYFKNKDELLLHVMGLKFESIHQELLRIQNTEMPPPDKLQNIISTLLTLLENFRDLAIIVIDAKGLSFPVRNSANAKRNIFIKIIAKIIEEGIEKGFFKNFEAIQVAKLIYGTIHASFQIKIDEKDDHRTVEENIANIVNLIFSGLSSED